MNDTRPSWQADPCPGWCAGGHAEHDHPDDRVHRSLAESVPVVVRRTAFGSGGVRRSAEAVEFEVALSRVDGERETWVYIGEGPAMFVEVTAESAGRVLGALADVLARSR